MRCPNCGNENPDDYTFCDECGAKLTADISDAGGAGMDGDTATAPTTASDMAEMMIPAADASAEPAVAATAVSTAGGVCPNCGAATVPGEAFCNECGAELATAASDAADGPVPAMDAASALTPDASAAAPATDMADASNTMEPYMGTTPGATEGDAGAVPVSEDTVAASPAATDTTGGAADVTAMPGVVPVAEADAGSTMPAEPAPMPAPPMPAMPAMAAEPMAGGGSTAAWATEVLRQLEEAQASMAKGDWVAYGTSMSALKAYLESVVKGTAAEVAGMDVTAAPVAMPAAPAAMPALEAEAIAAPTTAPADGVAAGAGAGSGMARLVVIATGAEMPLPQQEEITVGREDPSSGIFPDIDLTPYGGEDGGVSRRHARLLHVGGDYFVEDLQSTNYTKLDGQRLPARVREKLEDGARLDFGRVAMIFRKG